MGDWGLQAIIRPKLAEYDHMKIKEYDHDQAVALLFYHDQAGNMISEQIVVADDDNQLHLHPFYDHLPADDVFQTNIIHHQEIQQELIKNVSAAPRSTQLITPKPKKSRKNQQKRVVIQVTADGLLSSDPWAWRKYGQKPIKGSIYPRSYYKCSTSKDCKARRQLEQSCTDSSIYILTYTADHNHPQPTRRNSLAGINRNRFKATPTSNNSVDGGKTTTVTISKDSSFDSPTTLSVSSIEDHEVAVLQQYSNIKLQADTSLYNKFDNQGHGMMPAGIFNDDDYVVFSDDFFEGLEDLGGYKMESSVLSHNASSKQFPHVFC